MDTRPIERKKNPATNHCRKIQHLPFADYKEQVIDLLKRVCTVYVKTMQVVEAMNNLPG